MEWWSGLRSGRAVLCALAWVWVNWPDGWQRHSVGVNLRRLRLERGLSLRNLASECAAAAQRLRFRTHTPEHYQIVAYESGRLGAHPRTARVIAAALGVAPDLIYG